LIIFLLRGKEFESSRRVFGFFLWSAGTGTNADFFRKIIIIIMRCSMCTQMDSCAPVCAAHPILWQIAPTHLPLLATSSSKILRLVATNINHLPESMDQTSPSDTGSAPAQLARSTTRLLRTACWRVSPLCILADYSMHPIP